MAIIELTECFHSLKAFVRGTGKPIVFLSPGLIQRRNGERCFVYLEIAVHHVIFSIG